MLSGNPGICIQLPSISLLCHRATGAKALDLDCFPPKLHPTETQRMTQSYLSDSLHILEEKTSAYTQEKGLLQMRHLILRVTSR